MTLIIGPITDTDSPNQAVARALQGLQPDLEPEHVQVVSVHRPPDLDAPLWRWVLTDVPQAVTDPDITVFPGALERGRWRSTGPATPGEIRQGIAIQVEGGWVVAAAHLDDEDDDLALAEQALIHIEVIEGS